MLSARGLGRKFGRQWVLRDINLDLSPGQVTAVLGPNGAGKTSLIRLLAGVDRPQAGSVHLDGRPLLSERGLRGAIGLVTHRPRLYPELRPAEQLRYQAGLHGLRPSEGELAAWLEAEGLGPWRGRPIRTLSRGLQQRLALRAALVAGPRVLLLDEPFTGLDPAAAEALAARLRQARAGGAAILLATHDLERLPGVADRLLVLAGGREAWRGEMPDGDAAGLRERYLGWTAQVPPGGALSTPGAELNPSPSSPPSATPATRAPSLAASTLTLLRKDLLVEWRAREAVLPALLLGLIVTVIFQFGLPRAPDGQAVGAAGALWAALLFAGALAQGRSFAAELGVGGLISLRAAPVDLAAAFVAKWLGACAAAGLVLAGLLPAFTVWLGLPPGRVPLVAAIGALGMAAWCAAGTLVAALSASTRAREALLPVLGFPLALPLLLPAVQATRLALAGAPAAQMAPPLVLVGAFGLIYWVLGLWLLPVVLEDPGD